MRLPSRGLATPGINPTRSHMISANLEVHDLSVGKSSARQTSRTIQAKRFRKYSNMNHLVVQTALRCFVCCTVLNTVKISLEWLLEAGGLLRVKNLHGASQDAWCSSNFPCISEGKKCPKCMTRIYHDKWNISPKLAEERWAHHEARKRELDEVVDFLSWRDFVPVPTTWFRAFKVCATEVSQPCTRKFFIATHAVVKIYWLSRAMPKRRWQKCCTFLSLRLCKLQWLDPGLHFAWCFVASTVIHYTT